MDIDLRQAIYNRVQNHSNEELREIIDDCVGAEEQVMPGLGVLFEIIWENGDADLRQQIITTLSNGLQQKLQPDKPKPKRTRKKTT